MGIPTTLTGNATSDVEVKYTQAGKAVCSFSVAQNERRFNRQSNDWEDLDPTFVRVTVWEDLAEHAGASIRKGVRVIVTGKIEMRTYQDKDGVDRSSLEMKADDLAVSIKYGTVQYQKAAPKGQGNRGPAPAAVADEPWSQPQGVPAGGGGYPDETPF